MGVPPRLHGGTAAWYPVNRWQVGKIPAFPDPDTKRVAFEAAALPHTRGLYRFARRLTGSEDGAADLVQETWLRAYRTFENFVPGTNCRAWLFTILRSVFVNQQRRRAPVVLPPEAIDARASAPAPEPGDTDWSPEVERALAHLPVDFRLAVLLVDVEELTYEEAAAAAGCPLGTLRSRLFRGRTLLAGALADHARRAGHSSGEAHA